MKKVFLTVAILSLVACSSPTSTTPNVVAKPDFNVPVGKQQTERLRGVWAHTFTITSTFTDKHELTSAVTESTGTPGDYFISGKDSYGEGSGGGFNTKLQQFLVVTLHPAFTFDDAYAFNLDSSGTVASGCYYLYTHSGNLSNCFALSGRKIASLNTAFLHSKAGRFAPTAMVQNLGLTQGFQAIRSSMR